MLHSFHIREANIEDAEGMAKVRVDTWRSAYKGIVPDEFLANLSVQAGAERWRKTFWEERQPGVKAFVAENEVIEIIGIAACGPDRDDDPIYNSEIYVLYVLPGYQNQGIGRCLVAACVHHLLSQLNVTTLLIWVIAENPYRKFYESIGGRLGREKSHVIGGKPILEVGYCWDDLAGLAVL